MDYPTNGNNDHSIYRDLLAQAEVLTQPVGSDLQELLEHSLISL